MEKRKKWEVQHWITPGVFSGHYVAEEAVERISTAQSLEISVPIPQANEKKEELEALRQQVHTLQAELREVKELLDRWEKKSAELEAEHAKERQHLYQVVLSLKQEWEKERNEDRDH
ncbi:hypothetical protein ACAF76_011745 [Brevibacillus sp. TJ4]|uniref:hypothetical protein n=1 Tax=Brevibacillus sp. TJ4 TaxID=3234853 RepID=UPI0037CF4084